MSLKHENYISTAELAKFLGISVVAVFKRIKKGQIKATKIGRSYAIPYSYIQEEFPKYKIPAIDEGQYISVMQAAKRLGISRVAVYKKVKKGILEAKRVGRHFVIATDAIENVSQNPSSEVSNSQKEYFSVPEYAEHIGVSRVAIFKRIQTGSIKALRVGGKYIIPRNAMDQNVESEVNYLSVLQVAQKLGVSRITIFKRIKSGKLSAVRIGRSYMIPKSEVYKTNE